jgi:hypothetical protein
MIRIAGPGVNLGKAYIDRDMGFTDRVDDADTAHAWVSELSASARCCLKS